MEEQQDILSVLNTTDLLNTDIAPRLIKHGSNVRFNLVGSPKLVTTKDGLSQNIEIAVKTAEPVASTKGDMIDPGFQLTHRISLKEVDKNGKPRKESIMRDCAAFKLAVTGTKAGSFMPLEQYANMQVVAKVLVDKDETGQYADQNRIGTWLAQDGKALK